MPACVLPSKGLDGNTTGVVAELQAAAWNWCAWPASCDCSRPNFAGPFRRRLNIHPSLLPAFPGLDAQKQALEHGVKISGCTVHFVDEQLDAGPIILQAAVPVEDSDSVDALSRRILQEEHRIYTEAIRTVLSGRWRVDGRRVVGVE